MNAGLTELVARYRDEVVPHLGGDARDMVDSDVASGDEWLLVADCLEGALLGGVTIAPDLLALTEAEVRTAGDHPRAAGTLALIEEHRARRGEGQPTVR